MATPSAQSTGYKSDRWRRRTYNFLNAAGKQLMYQPRCRQWDFRQKFRKGKPLHPFCFSLIYVAIDQVES